LIEASKLIAVDLAKHPWRRKAFEDARQTTGRLPARLDPSRRAVAVGADGERRDHVAPDDVFLDHAVAGLLDARCRALRSAAEREIEAHHRAGSDSAFLDDQVGECGRQDLAVSSVEVAEDGENRRRRSVDDGFSSRVEDGGHVRFLSEP